MTDAPERTPLSERIRTWSHGALCHCGLDDLADEVAALEQERDARYEDLLERFEGYGLDRENLRQDNLRLRAAIGEAREFLHQPGPVGINTFHLMLDGILKGALTKPEGEK